MKRRNCLIFGQVVTGNGASALGLRVELRDPNACFRNESSKLNDIGTPETGKFTFCLSADQHGELFKAATKLIVRDAIGNVVGTGKLAQVKPGAKLKTKIVVRATDLECHAKLSGRLPDRPGLVIGEEAIARVGAAWEMTAHRVSDTRRFPRDLALCPLPPLARTEIFCRLRVMSCAPIRTPSKDLVII